MGHLADLRGDRDQGRRRRGPAAARAAPTRRTTATSSRSSPTASATPEADQGVRPLRPRGARDRPEPPARLPVRGRQQPERAVLPLDGAARRHGSGRASPTQLGADRRQARGDGDHHGRRLASLPDVAYLTSAQLGRPFPVRWVAGARPGRPDHSVRKQFTDGKITRGKKFEGVCGTDKGVYVVNSFAFDAADLPADAVKHDGMVWFYDYRDQTITLVTYFPHQTDRRDRAPPRSTPT